VDLTLHVADENGLINLGGIVPPGAHYTAARNENTGVVRLVPVKVATTVVQAPDPVQANSPDTQPWA
jgi:hypothetical protein